MAHFLSCAFSSLGARRISRDVLLLSRCVLQSFLGRSASMHSGRAAQKLLGGAFLPAHHAKCASILSLSGAFFSNRAFHRRLESAVVPRRIWNWRGHDCARNQRCFARRLHIWVSLATTSGRRISGSIFTLADMLSHVRVRQLFQSTPHAVGVAQFVLGRLFRFVRAVMCDGHLARCPASLTEISL